MTHHTDAERAESLALQLAETYAKEGQFVLAEELRRLHAHAQELEAELTARMTQNDRMAERIAELEAQVQRAAEAERAAILLRVKNRAVAGALLVEDFRSIVADRGPAAPAPQGLRKAAQAVVDRWDTPLWKDVPATAVYIADLRAALAAAPQPPEARDHTT